MPTYPESGVKLVVLTADAQSAVDDLMSSLDELQGATYSVEVTVEADTSDAMSAIEDLPLSDETVNYTVETEITGDNVDELPQDGEKAEYEVDTTIKEGNTDTADTLKVLKSINAKETFEMIVNIAGTALDFLKAFEQFSIEPLLDIDDAVAKIKAQTGETIPNIREIVSGIRYDDLGESFDQITDIIIKAKQMGVPFEEATRAALTFTHAFTDQDPKAVLDTLNAMVTNKLAPNFKEASDLLTVAFQKGGNRAGDLLSTITKNATAFRDLNMDGKTALGNIVDGLNKGFSSADQVANVFNKIKQNVQNAAGNETSPINEQLKNLSIPNPAEAGKDWGVEFVAEVIKGIQNAPVSDAEKEKMLGDILGDKFSGKSFSALMQLSPEDAANIFVNVKGAADTAAKDADDSLKGAFADFTLGVQQKVQEVLTDKSIDIPGKITKLKEGLQNALDTLAQGGTLSEALTVALKPLGFDDEFQGLESALGNFIIALLQIVSSIQDLTGHGAEAEGTRKLVVGMAKTQLDFDLKIANPEDLQLAISTATSRGLSDADIAKEISGTIQGLIKEGTKESLAQAQKIIDTLKTPIDQNKLPTLASGAPMNVEPVVSDEALDNLQGQIDTAMAKVPPPEKVDAWQQSLDAMSLATDTMQTATTNAQQPIDNAAKSTDNLAKSASKVYPSTDKTSDSLATVTVQANTATPALIGVSDALQVVIDKAHAVSSAADTLAQKNAQPDAGNTPTSGPHAAGGSFVGTGIVGEKGAEIVSSNTGLAVLNNLTTEKILAALNGFIPGASNVGKSGNNYTAINNNFVQSEAQADSVGFSTAKVLRGMG